MHPLLRQKSHLLPRGELVSLIDRLIDNLVNITDETGRFLLHLEDGRAIDTKGWAGWEWTHGIGLYGLYKYGQMTGQPAPHDIIRNWFSARFAEGVATKNVNTAAPFLTAACLYQQNPDCTMRPYLDIWGEWLMHEMPRTLDGGMQHLVYHLINDQQLWDDTLMMSALTLAKIGQALDRPQYIDEAKYQFLLHIRYLADPKTGLWFHGWDFNGRHNFAKALWARGNAWITIVIPEFIEMLDLPEGDPLRRHLLSVLEAQARSLRDLQDDSGLWHTLLDDRDSYLEASATAGFAYGLLKAVRKRYLPAEYAAVGQKAIRAVIGNINPEGELLNVSFGTGMGDDLDYYRQIPRTSMPYGQAMAIFALTEYLHDYI